MAAPPSPQLQALQAWLARLGLSGKILAGGGLVGIIAVFLPLLTMSMQMPAPGGGNLFGHHGVSVNLPAVSSSQSVLVVGDWRGVLCLLGYVAALALAFVLYPQGGLGQKDLAWAGLGVGAFIALLAIWLMVIALNGSGGMMGFGFQISVGFGAILNLLTGAAVVAGGFLKAREEIFPPGKLLLGPQKNEACEVILAEEIPLSDAPALTAGATVQPAVLATAVKNQPPLLPVAQPLVANAQNRRDREDNPVATAVRKLPSPLLVARPPVRETRDNLDQEDQPTGPSRSADLPIRKPSGGSPVVLPLVVGGCVVLGVIAGLAIWKFPSDDPQRTNTAIVQNVPGKQDKDSTEKESEPGDDARVPQEKEPAPVEPPKLKKSNPANDVPVPQDKVTATIAPLKAKDSKPGDDMPAKQDKVAAAIALKAKDSKPDNDVPTAPPRRLNLLSIVDLNVDLVEGKNKWRLQDQTLICDTGHFVPRVQIRFEPPEEYDFSVTFTQTKNLRNGVTMVMPKPGGGMFFWTVGMRNGSGYGFGPQGQNGGGDIAKLIQTNRAYTTTVKVRRNGVMALLDGQLLVSRPTNFRDLTTDGWHRMPNERVLGVGCDDPTTFHRVTLVEVSGQGKAIR